MERLRGNGYWLDIADAIGAGAPCTRRQVGAIIVSAPDVLQDSRIWAMGVNTGPYNAISCKNGGCPRGLLSKEECPPYTPYEGPNVCHATHAEVRAITQFQYAVAFLSAEVNMSRAREGWANRLPFTPFLFVNHKPCGDCQKAIDFTGMTAHWRSS